VIGPPEQKKPLCGANQQRGQSESNGSEPKASLRSRSEDDQAVNFRRIEGCGNIASMDYTGRDQDATRWGIVRRSQRAVLS
jgi:hypothetical protein